MSSFMEKEIYEIGDVLCDMHYQFEQLPSNLEVLTQVVWSTVKASELIVTMSNTHPGNKMLVIVGESFSFKSSLVAAYSYDGIYFGIVELRYKIRNQIFSK